MTNSVAKPSTRPLSNLNYDLLTILQTKLEGLAAYDQYLKDCQEVGDAECQALITQLRHDDEKHAQLVRDELERIVFASRFR
jgi:bacterioferritin (cytochrome b1)